MTPREEILQWLQGQRHYEEGVEIYQRHGFNLMLKQRFRMAGKSALTEMTLEEELRKLAGLSETEMKNIKRKVAPPSVQPVRGDLKSPFSANRGSAAAHPNAATETAKKFLRFRERFPFLNNPECPDVLKVAVADMFTAYGRYKEAHAKLATMADDADAEETAKLAEEVVENYLQDRELWAELEHYRDHGELLGKAKIVRQAIEKKSLSALTDVELFKQLHSAKTQISKAKAMAKKADADDSEAQQHASQQLARWKVRHALIEEEIQTRKKK